MSVAEPVQKGSKRERTRESIIDAYIDLLDSKSYDKVSVSALCKQAGIVRSTFYVYFSDIYEVIQEIEDELLQKFNAISLEAKEHRLEDELRQRTEWDFPILPPYGFEEWFDVCEENARAMKAMLGPNGDPYFEAKLRRQLIGHVERLMNADKMPNDGLRKGFVEAFLEVHILLVHNWLLHENTSLDKTKIKTIINTMRIGGNAEGHYYAMLSNKQLDVKEN